ncbi:MAG: YcnI family protein, partial [Salinibacterium sp.]|nr:YcnI family protein [Salinibacterium sp.]
AVAGSYTVINFTVPNESETQTTTRPEVVLPTDTPFTSVRYVPVAGWSAELVRDTLPQPVMVGTSEITDAVTSVIWTAEAGSEIAADQVQVFPLSVGPVPDTGSITMPTDQTYSDGSAVSWSEAGDDAEYPAPVLYINDVAVEGHHGGAAAEATTGASSAGSIDVLARVLGITGLVAGVVGLVLAFTVRRPAAQ